MRGASGLNLTLAVTMERKEYIGDTRKSESIAMISTGRVLTKRWTTSP